MNLKALGFYRAWAFIGNNGIGFRWVRRFWESQTEFLSSHMITVLKFKTVLICLFVYSFLLYNNESLLHLLPKKWICSTKWTFIFKTNPQVQPRFLCLWMRCWCILLCTNMFSHFSFIFLFGHFCGFILLDKCCWSRIIIWSNALI